MSTAMTTSTPSNSSLSYVATSELHCPLLEKMLNHSLNKDTHVNLLVVSVLGLVSCLGILENALVLWVLGFRLRRKTVAAVWVINLALSDFLATLTLPLFTYYFSVGHSWELGQALCSAEASIFFLNMYVSAFLLAAISLDRCLLVVKPVWSQNQRTVEAAWKVCLLGWLWAGFNTVPYFLFRNVTVKRDKRKLCYHNFALYSSPATLEFDCKLRQAATAVSKALLAFLVPLVVIAVSYGYFFQQLRARRQRRESRQLNIMAYSKTDRSSAGAERLSKGFTKMVASVIATFALCWAPYHFFCLLEVAAQYFPSESYLVKLVEQGLPLSSVFAFLNPVLNPIIYTFSCPHFCTRIRQSLGLLFEGLVEEAGPLVLATSRIIRRDPNSPTSPSSLSSPTTPTLLRLPRLSQGSVSIFNFKKCPTEESGQKV
ncbi:prostaglandin D2 receptor 2 [Astyanax mexicanus]|uniref:prostaglandin D2 receptor 2 n=1 Tax=Astyanax mexicanus TaxID=7994 RepID=UPI000BBDC667|nr:prostaglandin D2 receptor 2 [Astyanax mexicanus]